MAAGDGGLAGGVGGHAAVEAVGKRVVVGSDDFPIPDPFVFQRPFRFLERPVDRGAVRADDRQALRFPRASASGRERQPEYGPDEDLALKREWNGIHRERAWEAVGGIRRR